MRDPLDVARELADEAERTRSSDWRRVLVQRARVNLDRANGGSDEARSSDIARVAARLDVLERMP